MSSNSFHYSPPTQYNNSGPINTKLDEMYRDKIRSLVIGQNQECLFCTQKFPTYTLHLHDKKTDKDHTSGIGFISERCATVLRSFADISGGQIRNIANSKYSKEEYQLAESTGNEYLRRIYFPTNFQDEKHKPKAEVLLKGSDQQKSQFDKQVSQLVQKFIIEKAYYKPQALEQLDVTYTKDKIDNFQPNTLSRINHMVPTSTIDKLSGKEEEELDKSMNTLTLKTSPRGNPSQVKSTPNTMSQQQQQQQLVVQQKPLPQQQYTVQQQQQQQSYPVQPQQYPMQPQQPQQGMYYPPQQHYYGNTQYPYPTQPQYGMMPPQQPLYQQPQQFMNYPLQQPHQQQQPFYQQQQVPYYGQQSAPKAQQQPQQPTYPTAAVNPFSDEYYFGTTTTTTPPVTTASTINIPPVNTASIVNNTSVPKTTTSTTTFVPPKTTTNTTTSAAAPPAPPAPTPNQLKTSPRAPTTIAPSTTKVSPRAPTITNSNASSTTASKPPMAPSTAATLSSQIQQQQQLLKPASTESYTANRDKRTGSVGSNQNTAATTNTTTTGNTTTQPNTATQNRARSASGGINFNQTSPRGGLATDAQFQLEKISKDEADAHSFEKERERATKLDDLQAQARTVKGEDDDIVWNIKPTLKPMAMKKVEKQ